MKMEVCGDLCVKSPNYTNVFHAFSTKCCLLLISHFPMSGWVASTVEECYVAGKKQFQRILEWRKRVGILRLGAASSEAGLTLPFTTNKNHVAVTP